MYSNTSSQVNTLLGEANAAATVNKKRVERLAKLLADAMKDIHGGDWRLDINHDAEAFYAMVAPKRGFSAKPTPEAA
jgi:hypothetical protein